jgi:hypothetical protein
VTIVNRFYIYCQIAEKGRFWTETKGCASNVS